MSVIFGKLHRRRKLAIVRQLILRPLAKKKDHILASLADVDRDIGIGRYKRALRTLAKHSTLAPARYFAELRRADIHFLAGRVPSAHLAYLALARELDNRHVGAIAAARAAAIAHVVDGKLPGKPLMDELRQSRLWYANPARITVAHILILAGRLDEALEMAILAKDEGADLVKWLLPTTMRRHLWQGRPYRAALAYLRVKSVALAHPRRGNLLELLAQSYLDLGLAKDAARVLHRALKMARAPAAEERITAQLVRAYQQANDLARALQSADYYLFRYHRAATAPEIRKLRANILFAVGDRGAAARDIKFLRKATPRKQGDALADVSGDPAAASAPRASELERLIKRQQQILGAKTAASKGLL